MGRHAQRRIAGGGPRTTGTSLLQIVSIFTQSDGLASFISWSGPVDVNDFAAADFLTSPSNTEPNSLQQAGANALRLEWSSSVKVDAFLRYIGSVTGTLTPQVVKI